MSGRWELKLKMVHAVVFVKENSVPISKPGGGTVMKSCPYSESLSG